MAYPDDLLALAQEILDLHAAEPHQPSLRRALSTAYHALFHLLIEDAVAGCQDPELRAALSRMFDHGRMLQASRDQTRELNGFLKRLKRGKEDTMKEHLLNVAATFAEAQDNRNEADYNLSREWQPKEVSLLILRVEGAFKSWSLVRSEKEARDYLLSMLPARKRKQPDRGRSSGPLPAGDPESDVGR
jgi:hypothetical protein